MKKNSKIDDTKEFFEKKFQTKIVLEEFEKLIFDASKKLDEAGELVRSMEEIAVRRKAYYFLHRTKRLGMQLEDLFEKKGYSKKEFDILYNILDKISENDSSEFLDQVLREKIDKVAVSLSSHTNSPSPYKSLGGRSKYFTFEFRGVYFIGKKHSYKIIKNVNPMKKNVRIGKKRFPIQPGPAFGLPPEDDGFLEATHLCILVQNTPGEEKNYRCFFFHKMDREIQFDESTVKSRLHHLEENTSPYIRSYFRYGGRNYYLIE